MIWKKVSANLVFFSFFLFSFLPLIPNKVKGLVVILFFVFSVFYYILNKERKSFPFKKVLFFNSLYFVLLLSLIITENFIKIDKPLATPLSLLVIPLSFGLVFSVKNHIFKKRFFLKSYIFLLNIISTIFSICILYVLNNQGVFNGGMSFYDAIAYVTNEMWLISQHPIYASLYISISLLLGFYLIFNRPKKKVFLILIPLIILQLVTLIILDRKGVLFSFVISFSGLLLFSLKRKYQKLTKLIPLIMIISLSFLALKSNRFKEIFNKDNYSEVLKYNSTNIRYNIYMCSIEKIRESFWFGFGVGDVQSELNKCYKNKSSILTDTLHNSHNQYLSYFLIFGVFGFLVLIIFIGNLFIKSFLQRKILLFILTLFFAINLLFENLLERQSGVIIFTFYLCFFYFFQMEEKKLV